MLFQPVMEHLREVGEARSATEIEDALQAQLQCGRGDHGLEYLADQRLIAKASTPVSRRGTLIKLVGHEQMS